MMMKRVVCAGVLGLVLSTTVAAPRAEAGWWSWLNPVRHQVLAAVGLFGGVLLTAGGIVAVPFIGPFAAPVIVAGVAMMTWGGVGLLNAPNQIPLTGTYPPAASGSNASRTTLAKVRGLNGGQAPGGGVGQTR